METYLLAVSFLLSGALRGVKEVAAVHVLLISDGAHIGCLQSSVVPLIIGASLFLTT